MKTKQKNNKFIRHILLPLLFLFAIAATASCGGGSGSGNGGGGTSGGGDGPAAVVTGPDGVKLSIPGGSVSQDTTYRIARDSDGAPSTAGLTLLTPIYAVTPHSQSFAEGALIEIPYNVSNVPSGSIPFVLRADAGGQWQAFGNARLANGTAKADLSSLSYYAIGVCAQGPTTPGDCPFNSVLRLELLDNSGNAIPVEFNSWGQALPVITVDQPTTLNFHATWTRPPNINRTDIIGLSLSGGQLQALPDYWVPPDIEYYGIYFDVYINPATLLGASNPNGRIVRMEASVYGSYLAFVGPPIGFDYINWEMWTSIDVRVRYNGVQPTITQQPANQAVTAGQTATFTVAASGSPTYLWQRSNDNGQSFSEISGATLPSYTTAATALSDNGALFRVQVCSGSACVDSGAAALMVTALSTPPTFTQQPASMAVLVGQTASFTAVAIGPPAPSIQWYKWDGFLGDPVGTPCSSSGNFTSCTYTTPALALADSGSQYYAVATNSAGSVQSATVTVTVTSAPVAPTITTQPSDVTVCAGSGATFSVAANGTALLSYRWLRNGSISGMTGQNGTSYTLTNAKLSDSGSTFSVEVSNSAGSVTSNNAILTVTSCSTYTVGGTVSGLSGTGLVLQNNGGDNLAISSNGAFTFATPLANGTGYAVTVLTQPSGQNCIITNGSGTISGANITNVAVACGGSNTVTDIDGNVYNTVTIGTQVWMKENLKVTKYRNGESIGTTTPATLDISGETSPKYQWAYDGNESNVADYGRLYTWYAVTDSRGICPTGWHLPTDAEWTTLTDYLGGESVAGGKMKEAGTAHWNSPNTGADNSSGFTALPGGYRLYYGSFIGIGNYGFWWSASEYDATFAWSRFLFYNYTDAYRNYLDKNSGFSVRCVKD